MKWGLFLMNIKEELVFLNNLIKNFFTYKFLEITPSFKVPSLSSPSYLLNTESLSLLYLSNSFLQTTKKLKLLYSSTAANWNFDVLSEALMNYKGSTLLLFKHEENLEFVYDKTTSTKNYVFGVFQYMAWGDITKDVRGTEETSLFSLTPGFKIFNAKKNYDNTFEKRFSVIVNSKNENGLGLGWFKFNIIRFLKFK